MQKIVLFTFFSLWLGTFQAQFGPEIEISKSVANPESFHLEDLDQDGDLDMISASFFDNKIAWFENLGDGSFGEQKIITTDAVEPKSVFGADLDEDGDVDVLSASEGDGKIAWYENLGGGYFGDQQIISLTGLESNSVYSVDLDGDGDMDVLSASSYKIAWHKNLGGGNFGSIQTISNGVLEAREVYSADLDGDGDMDVLSASFYDNRIAWYENLGGGSFGTLQSLGFADDAQSVHSVDLDGDGDMDVLSASSGDDTVEWYENDGNGSFTFGINISNNIDGASSVYTADLDSDGDMDIIASSLSDDKVVWFENIDIGVFGPEQIVSDDVPGATFVYSEDVDGDGDLDIMWASLFDDKIAWQANDGNASFGIENVITASLVKPESVYTADLDNDGDQDVLSASSGDNRIAWYQNIGDGLFGPQQTVSTDMEAAQSVHSNDLNGDGIMDVLSASWDGKIAWYENLGSGSFGSQQLISTNAIGAQSVFSIDLDDDGDVDVISASRTDNKIAWYENLGDGSFTAENVLSNTSDQAMAVYSADLDGDSDMDIVSASYTDQIQWFENFGDGIFSTEQDISTNSSLASDVKCVDIDDDGKPDVLSAYANGGAGGAVWFKNLGEGLFGEQQFITTSLESANAAYAYDIDGDGDKDVLSTSGLHQLRWSENLGNGQFGVEQILNPDAGWIHAVHAADLDGDGDLEAITTSYFQSKIAQYENFSGMGCMDPGACNFDVEAYEEDGSCCYSNCGCTYIEAENYNSSATCDDGSCEFVVFGTVFYDENENSLMDDDEYGLSMQELQFLPDSLLLTTNANGQFYVNQSDSSSYSFILEENPLFPFFTTPQTQTFLSNTDNWTQEIFFGISNEDIDFDLEANFYSLGQNYPCDELLNHSICFTNSGNVPLDVELILERDSLFQGVEEVSTIDDIVGNFIYLSQDNVLPGQSICLTVKLHTPTVEHIGEYLESSVSILGFFDGEQVAIGSDSIIVELTCAYDPNDKQVFPIGYSDEHYIANDTIIEYLIRFQNTGNAPATDIHVRDTLDVNLDISTFQLVANSHSVFTTIDPNTREIDFFFQDINLPDSVNNEPESHGLISYKIRPLADLPLLTELNNYAAIYFDNNPPIITNTTWSTIYDCSLFEVDFTDDGPLLTASEGDSYQWYLEGEEISGATSQEHLALEIGNYSVEVNSNFPCSGQSASIYILDTSIEELSSATITLFPNPMTDRAIIDIGDIRGLVDVEIYDAQGKLIRSEKVNSSNETLQLERRGLSQGSYTLSLRSGERSFRLGFVVGR